MKNCPVCELGAECEEWDAKNQWRVHCIACGRFTIPAGVGERLVGHQRPRLSHAIRLRQQGEDFVAITREMAELFVKEFLPSHREQVDALVLIFGDLAREYDPIRPVKFSGTEMAQIVAKIGAFNSGSIGFLFGDLAKDGLVDWKGGDDSVRLLEPGWHRYDELKSATPYSRVAFMAMPFNDPAIEAIFRDVWCPAVARAGFELKTVAQRAGNIDDHIRVDIRRSRFLISELTGGNHGAYWEAGFAEGLNKPVIYTCEKSYFVDPGTKPHFDVNHFSHVIWERDRLADAANSLTARIRASIPEAKLSD